MNSVLECQLFMKAKKLIQRKIRNLTSIQNVLMNEDFFEALSAIDDMEESFVDILIFDVSRNFHNYKESLSGEISDMDEMKKEIIQGFEMSIADCREMTDNESLNTLQLMIESSKNLAERYFDRFFISINILMKKLSLIKNIQVIQRRLKKVRYCYSNHIRNLSNLHHLIAVTNANRILVENFENLEFLLEEAFQNPQTIAEKIHQMEPTNPFRFSYKCPPLSDSESSDEFYFEEAKKEEKKPSVECLPVQLSPDEKTRMDSIEKLETTLENLDGKIESIEDEKLCIKQEICMKRKKLQEAIMKVIEFEMQIEELETMIEGILHRFQLRLIALETKLMNNFQGDNDFDLKVFLEQEINDIKLIHKKQMNEIQTTRDELVQKAHTFAVSLGPNILDEFQACHCANIKEETKHTDATQIKRQYSKNRQRLEKLLSRPAKYCRDPQGERFYINSQQQKIYKVDSHSSEYAVNSEGNRMRIKKGFTLQTNESGEFYLDSQIRKIYTKLYFEDEHGRYYIDIHGNRFYHADPQASEYKLVDGQWIKIRDGTYETDEHGMRKIIISESKVEEKREDEEEEMKEDFLRKIMGNPEGKNIKSEDIRYIQETVGPAIRKGLAAVAMHKPADPVTYFANFLLHYRFTQNFLSRREAELKYFLELREKNKELSEKCHKE